MIFRFEDIPLCFGLLGCSKWLLGRGYEVLKVIRDWPFAVPSQMSPPSCSYDTSIQRTIFDLFEWKSMEPVAMVLYMVARAWLDSVTLILRD